MKTIQIMKKVGKGYLYVIGFFFVLMAFDCFGPIGCPNCDSFWEQLLCFGISIVPGAIIVVTTYFLRNHERLLGILLMLLSIVAFFFFRFYREFWEKIPTFLLISFVPFIVGAFFVFIGYSQTKDPE